MLKKKEIKRKKNAESSIFRYLAVCQDSFDAEENEVLVTFLREVTKKPDQLFLVDEKDLCYVKFEDILEVLEDPSTVSKRNRTYFKWDRHLQVVERS